MDQETITGKGWRRDIWKDHLTLEVTQIEVTPEDDLNYHVSSPDCNCIPELTNSNGIPMLIHNSFDGRETNETNERGH
jgi:hypothetical protein